MRASRAPRRPTKRPTTHATIEHPRRHVIRPAATVLIDFDNTVTSVDVLQELLRRFSINRHWMTLERSWAAGRIGSRVCLVGQLRGVRVSRTALTRFLATVTLDPAFRDLVKLLRRWGVRPIIVSDNFSFIVRRILQYNRVFGLRVYANRVTIVQDRLTPLFPYYDRSCPRGCAHCKRRQVQRGGAGRRRVIYIGDGRSDICPAEAADLVFAKGTLLRYLRRHGQPCVAFDHLGEVYDELQMRFKEWTRT